MANVREVFRPQPMGANALYQVAGSSMGGFLAKTAGTITITDSGANATILVDAVPVTAGFFTPIPILFTSAAGGAVQLAGGASGTLMV